MPIGSKDKKCFGRKQNYLILWWEWNKSWCSPQKYEIKIKNEKTKFLKLLNSVLYSFNMIPNLWE